MASTPELISQEPQARKLVTFARFRLEKLIHLLLLLVVIVMVGIVGLLNTMMMISGQCGVSNGRYHTS
jgi:hypothetical protein